MNRTHPAFWGAGWAGAFTGALLSGIGWASGGSDVAGLAGGYGLMIIGSAVFLLAGLKLRERLVDRADSIRVRRAAVARLTTMPVPATSSSPAGIGS